MLQCFTYHAPMGNSYQHHIAPTHYACSVQSYENKDYVDSIDNLILYLTQDKQSKVIDESGKITYTLPHGSIIISVSVDKNQDLLHIRAPFVSIEGSKIIPLLRKATQLNFSPLVLSRIVLEGDAMFFDYKTILEDTDPDKLYDILREICLQADTYDDEFIHKYNAVRLHSPEIIPYSDNQKEVALQNIMIYIREAEYVIDYFEKKRMSGFVWDILAILFMKIDFYLQPQGYLRKMLEDALDELFGDAELSSRIQKGKEFSKQLSQINKEVFFDSLYEIKILIPYKEAYGTDAFHKQLMGALAQAQDEYKNMDYYGCVLTIQYNLYRICYKGNFDKLFSDAIQNCLSRGSNKPMAEAAQIMLADFETLMTLSPEGILPEEDKRIEEKKGFFANLFSKK